MKYVAVRVAHKVNDLFIILGQRATDYNWETLDGCSGEFDFLPSANEAATRIAKALSSVQKNYVATYGLGGYGIGSFYNGKEHNK